MKKFICIHCGKYWNSSDDSKKPCETCMGMLLEVPMDRKDLERIEETEEAQCTTSTETI